MTRNFSRDCFPSIKFPSKVCNIRSTSFRCVVKYKCLVHNEYVFFAIFFKVLVLVAKEVHQCYMGYVSALYDKIMKQRTGI